MEHKPRQFKLVKRRYKQVNTNNNNNNNNNNDNNDNQINISELLNIIKRSLSGVIDSRAKYWMEQRIGLLLNNNALMKRNGTELKIDYDNNSGGMSWLFKYNGLTVAYIDTRGYLYCSNVLINGVNLLNAINNIINTNNTINNLGETYVKHIDLKNGTYEMIIKSIISQTGEFTNTLKGNEFTCEHDANNKLEYLSTLTDAQLLITTDKLTGFACFNPDLSNNSTIYGLRFGKASTSGNGCQLRYTHVGDNNNDNVLAMGVNGAADALKIYKNRRVQIYCPSGSTIPNNLLLCYYDANIGNGQYLRMSIGDKQRTAMIGLGKENGAIYGYFKLQSQKIDLKMFDYIAKLCGQKNRDLFNITTPGSTLSNNEYVTQRFSDEAGTAQISFFHDTQYYGLKLQVDTDNDPNDLNNLIVYPTGIIMNGQVDIRDDMYIWEKLYVDNVYSASGSTITLNNNTTITNELTVNGLTYFNNTININKSLEEGTTSNYIECTANYSDGIDLAFNYVGAGNSNNAFIVKYHSYGYALAISRYNTILYTGTLTQYANTTNTIYTMGKDSKNCFNITNTINYSDNPVVFTLTRNNVSVDQMKFDKNNGTIILTDLTFKNIKFNDVKTSSSSETDKVNDTTIPTSAAVKKMIGNNIYEKGNNTNFLHLNLSGNDSITYIVYSDKYGYFIAFSRSVSVYYSTDAITWQNVSMNLTGLTDFYAVSVVYNNYSGYFFVCDAMSNAIYYSRDGINNWQAYDFGTGHGYGQIAIKDDESGAHWMMIGGINASDFWYNPTGQPTDWHQFTINITSPPIIRGCVYNSFVKKFALSGQNKAYICDNLTLDNLTTATWTETTFTGFAGDVMRTTERGIFLCSASSTTSSYYCLGSPYQGNWYSSYQLDNGGGSCQIFDMCYGDDKFWFVTSTNNVYYSSSIYNNGNASKMVSPTNKLDRCCYGNGKMIATPINTTDYGIKYIYNNVYTNPITILQMAYPIGSIYTSMNDINPALLFGFGTWQALENYFLYSVPTATATGTTGGEATHKLTVQEMPSHSHKSWYAPGNGNRSWGYTWANTGQLSGTEEGINPTGGNQAHNNMPPYITVHAWQRVA